MLLLCKCNIRCKVLELLGKASYNIFLVQMFYYCYVANVVYSVIHNRMLQLIINICICVLGGIIFYVIEVPITEKIKNILLQKYNLKKSVQDR